MLGYNCRPVGSTGVVSFTYKQKKKTTTKIKQNKSIPRVNFYPQTSIQISL
jgi:hypothetical protein